MPEVKYYKRIFVTPSVVYYPEDKKQMVYLPKEVLDNTYNSIVGTPVFVTHDGDEPVGEVVDAYYSPEKAAYIAGFNVWDQEAQRLLDNKGYSVSCVYKIIDYDGAGTHNNIAYDEKVNDMKFTSLAIVDKPRFEQAQEKLNSINNNYSKDNMLKNRLNAESDEDYITFRGKQISFEDLGRVLMEEAAFHKGAPVADREAEENGGKENELEEKKVYVEDYPDERKVEEKEYFDNRCNADEDEDKRKILDEIGGMLKGKVDEELWRTIMGKAEKLAYRSSETGRNNAVEDDKVDVQKLRRDGKDRIEESLERKDERKNSLDAAYKASYKSNSITSGYKSRAERIAEDTAKYLN